MHPRLGRSLGVRRTGAGGAGMIGSRVAVAALAVCVAAGGLTACAPAGDAASTGSPSVTATGSPSPERTPTRAPIALVPEGTAEDNLPLFREITERVWAGKDRAHGRAYVDALVKAGFDKKAMQVTEDLSTVGNPAESIQFSVRWEDGRCLVGQVGPETGDPVAVVMPGLGGGRCLIGKTRVIDW